MKHFLSRFLIFLLAFLVVTTSLSLPQLSANRLASFEAVDTKSTVPFTVVLDAGHGGEDGGAVSAAGFAEKEANLAIALCLQELLEANGITVRLTRSEDILLYDRDVDYHGRKKALDLAARRKIAESTENCVFVSIHMNAYPIEKYNGLQVWYSPNNPSSRLLAENVQSMTSDLLQPDNNRKVKAATSSIYLLHHLNCPAILVECGFLSNPEEAAALATEDYQKKLAFLLFLSISESLDKLSDEIAYSP